MPWILPLARFARWQKMSLELYRKTFKHNNVVKLFIIALVKVVTCNIMSLPMRFYARTGLRGPRRGWTLNDMALSPEPKTPAGLAGGKKMVMVAGRRKMKYWETWFLTFGAGCMVGAVISPKSWFAIPVGMALTWIGTWH